MSRIGKLPVVIPEKVTVTIDNNHVTVKGPLGTLTQTVDKRITMKQEDNKIIFERANEENETKAMHGLYRMLVHNMIEGTVKGFEKGLVIAGVGYKVAKQGTKIVMNIGFSHPVEVEAPQGITFECPSATEITVKGIDKTVVGQCAAMIRSLKKPEPYHGYGIHYKDEVIQRKEGKTAGKK